MKREFLPWNKLKNGITRFRANWIGSGRQGLLKRHFRIILRHLTIKKVGNTFLNHVEFWLRRNRPISYPLYIKIEPTQFCHLRCPGCPHSDPAVRKQFNKKMQLKFEDFKELVDPLSDTLIGISLSNFGEPMWCEDLPKMIEYSNKKNIGTMFPTNLSVPLSEGQAEKLVKAGLDMIMVSLDGATKETYSVFRVGGNFDLVVENVRKLSDAKKKFNLSTPHIQWKFIVFDHNKHEVEYVKRNYLKMGFDSYSIESDWMDKTTLKTLYKKAYHKNLRNRKMPCFWLWHTMIISWDGEVLPCCNIGFDAGFDIGNAIKEGSKAIWKGKNYENLRSGFNRKEYGINMHPVCKRCIGLNGAKENIKQ